VYIPTPPLSPTASPAERFAWIIQRLTWVIFRGNTQPLLPRVTYLIHRLMNRYNERFARLAAFVAAGKTKRVMPPRPPRPADAPPLPPRAPRPASELPHGRGWMARLVPLHGAAAGQQIAFLLRDPEIKALVLSHPDFAPMLRCLQRMLGGDIPPWMRLPPRAKRMPGDAGALLPEGAAPRRRRAGPASPAAPPLEPLRPLDKRYRIPRSWKVPRFSPS